ncbi:hypothetical protein Tco_0146763, partial [Tanacetum coccineum]
MMHPGRLRGQQRKKLRNLTTRGQGQSKIAGKNKGSKASGSSTVNEDALA